MDVKEEEEHEKTLLSGEEQKEEGEQKLPSRVGGWIGWVGSRLGGTFTLQPEDLQSEKVSEATKEYINQKFGEFGEDDVLYDYHTHVFGVGVGETGCCCSREFFQGSVKKKLTGEVYMTAGGVTTLTTADADYIDRLVRLVRNFPKPARNAILAFDKHYNTKGEEVPERTEFFTPNSYVEKLSIQHDCLLPCISVHPYKPNAIQELEELAQKGYRMIKWLPNAHGIDPSHDLCVPFYEKMKEHDMFLLCHCGDEKAVEGEEYQAFGNPQLLRRALDIGAKVIIAHCASLGTNVDLEDPKRHRVSNFKLFMRMMENSEWEGRLFGDISAVVLNNRISCLHDLLKSNQIHHRLVNGSDYPLVGASILTSPSLLYMKGFITNQERGILSEIYNFNPLLYDCVLKMALRGPNGERFPKEMFLMNPLLQPSPKK